MTEVLRETDAPVTDSEFEALSSACFLAQGLSIPPLITLTLTDDDRIREYNREWRGIDQPTDVLSFPLLPLSPEDTLHDAHPALPQAWDSAKGAYLLGDVIISIPRAAHQAETYGHSLREEILYLASHGVLHLLGYDHHHKEDKRRMREKEKRAAELMSPLDMEDEFLLRSARQALNTAYAPYSKFRVGAALLGESGRVYTGCNIENVSYGLTNCAERTALFKAVSEGEKRFTAIAIAAETTAPWPCGACRQVLSEFSPKMKVLITWGDGQRARSTLDQLLPNSFLEFQEDSK